MTVHWICEEEAPIQFVRRETQAKIAVNLNPLAAGFCSDLTTAIALGMDEQKLQECLNSLEGGDPCHWMIIQSLRQ